MDQINIEMGVYACTFMGPAAFVVRLDLSRLVDLVVSISRLVDTEELFQEMGHDEG